MNSRKRTSGLLLILMILLTMCWLSVSASSSEVTIDDLIIQPGDLITATSTRRYHSVSAHEGWGYIDSAGRERKFCAIYPTYGSIEVFGPDLKYNDLDGKSYWVYKYNNEEVPTEIFSPDLYNIEITDNPRVTRATNYYLVIKVPEGGSSSASPKLIRTSVSVEYNNGSDDKYETVAPYFGGYVIRIKPDSDDNVTFYLAEWELYSSNYTLPECTLTPPEGAVFDKWNLGKPGETITLTKQVTTLEPQWIYSINDASVTIADQAYTGKALTPVPTVTISGKTLEKDKDYTVAYSNNTNVGTATITITGCGIYSGQIMKNFEIKEAPQPQTEDPSSQPQTDGSSSPDKPDGNPSSTQPAAVGTALTDDAGMASYSVTASDAAAPSVAYTGTTNKKAANITIPETVTISGITYKVTSIAPNAFKGNKKLKKVTIGANIKEIGKSAFASCPKLTTVNCKSKVLEKIGASAFQGDKKLTKITLKSTLLKKGTVGKNAFKGTSKKLVIKVPAKAKKAYKKFFKTKGNKKVTIK